MACGGAGIGDRTMVDALQPGIVTFCTLIDEGAKVSVALKRSVSASEHVGNSSSRFR